MKIEIYSRIVCNSKRSSNNFPCNEESLELFLNVYIIGWLNCSFGCVIMQSLTMTALNSKVGMRVALWGSQVSIDREILNCS